MRHLITFILVCSCSILSAQEKVDIRIISLESDAENVEMDYEEISFTRENGPSLMRLQFASPPRLSLPKSLTVYIIHPRLGLVRTHMRDLLRQGPGAWRDKVFRLHLEDGLPVKLEEIYIEQ